MKILAIETATMTGSVAIIDEESGLISEARLNINVAHAERLMPTIDWLLRSSRLGIEEMDGFAVSIGPGSFTGLRIGLSTAKGLSFSTKRPIIPVKTLDAFAHTFPFSSLLLCPMLDAKKQEVYTALYRWEGRKIKKVVPEMAIKPEEFLTYINEDTIFFGDGAKRYVSVIKESIKKGIHCLIPPPSKMVPSAAQIGELGILMLKEGISVPPETITPFYIRKSEAEIKFEK
ncbi:MAG: tRNA (adenosine(37)-N6)-threonylcarbamoyltransferase complex dimerization subunit type 1 TsaB [Nitrospirae bacterium]|nr:MAG: tRNA (adenosine(37)-N6)-threonylcarbamoyltransferase complex dimerization subunit type 1 TsaB [Nitrospirota bacterium]